MTTVELKPLAEITHEALTLLCQRLGVANTLRFINQFTNGYGNYTEERQELYAELSVDDIVAEIEKSRQA
jgi:hypothetical protein